MQLRLALQHGGGGIAGPSFEQTPLGSFLTGHGEGVGPVYNPAEDGNYKGSQSASSIEFFTLQELYEEMWQGAGYPGGFSIDGNGGSLGRPGSRRNQRGKERRGRRR